MKNFFCLICLGLSAALSAAETAGDSAVACVGKIVPGARIEALAAPSLGGSQAIVETLNIRRGSFVKEGEVVAVLRGAARAKAALARAESALAAARANADMKILQQENFAADLEGSFAQNQKILDEKDPPRREREEINYEQESLARKIAQAKSMVPLVKRAQELAVAEAAAAADEARAAFAEYEVRAPITGEVVESNVVPGEAVGMEGICEIADTSSMYAEAEVYVSDISRVSVGDPAEIFSDALEGKKFLGKVVQISSYVKSNRLFSSDPSDYSNLKVVVAKIKLDSPGSFRNLIGSQVSVRILVKKQ